MKTSICLMFMLCALIMGITSVSVGAHGFGPRYDLPVPLYLYLSGAGLAVALSFVAMSVVIKSGHNTLSYPTWRLLDIRRGHSLFLLGMVWGFRLVCLLLFVLTLVAGWFGDQEPVRNLAPTMVWIIFWVGLGIVVPIVGNVWELINPWKTIFDFVEWISKSITGSGLSWDVSYNGRYALIPGLVFLALFGWVENVYTDSAVPRHIAFLATSYTLSMLLGMMIFGKRTWLDNGDAFSILFKRLAGFGFLEMRSTDIRLCATCESACDMSNNQCVDCYACLGKSEAFSIAVRPWAMGLLHTGIPSTASKYLVIGILAIISFDGFSETPVWASVVNTMLPWMATTFPAVNDVYFLLMLISTVGLGSTVISFLLAYQITIHFMSIIADRAETAHGLAQIFVVTLLPIAVAYHLAHYLSLLAVQGQLLIPLLSDPLGFGSDLMGTADYKVNIGIVSSKFLWYFAVVVIVLGHVIAVYIAHMLSIGIFNDRRRALRSQYPMVMLMIGYTVISLWIIAQPITEVRIV